MDSRGLSLLELVLVVAVISTLLAVATLNLQQYAKRYRSEAQMRGLYGELMKVRSDAICQRRAIRVKLYPNRFEVYSSQTDSAKGAAPLRSVGMTYPVIRNEDDLADGFDIDFKETGFTYSWCAICLDPADGSGNVDSIVIAATRTSIGKKEKGNVCKEDSITFK